MTARKRSVRNAALWTGAGAFLLLGLIVTVSANGQTPKGEAIIENPGALIGIVITSLATLMGVILPVALRIEKNSEELKEQVQNDHRKEDGSPFLLRDDLDEKHDQVLRRLDGKHDALLHRLDLMAASVQALQGGVEMAIELSQGNASDVRGMRRDVGRLHDDLRANTKETTRVARIATGLIRTVGGLEGEIGAVKTEITDVKATIEKHHPTEEETPS